MKPTPADDDLVAVARFDTAGEAHVARTALEAAGIAALVMEQDGLRFDPFSPRRRPAVRLLVHREHAEVAAELLVPPDDSQPPDERG